MFKIAAMIDREVEEAAHRLIRLMHIAAANQDGKRFKAIARGIEKIKKHYDYTVNLDPYQSSHIKPARSMRKPEG